MSIVALLQGWLDVSAGAARRRDGELLEIEIELHQRLARQIDRGPAVECGVAERAGDAVDHHDGAVEAGFRLGDSGARNRSGASILMSAGMFCRSIGAAGSAALISNFSG